MPSKYQKLIMDKRLAIRELVLAIFKLDDLSCGLGKNNILRYLRRNDSNLKLSINTVKKIVDELLEEKIIECVNPSHTSGLRFRLTEINVDKTEINVDKGWLII